MPGAEQGGPALRIEAGEGGVGLLRLSQVVGEDLVPRRRLRDRGGSGKAGGSHQDGKQCGSAH